MENGAITTSHLKINSGCQARENPFEEAISERSQITELYTWIYIYIGIKNDSLVYNY